MRNQILFLTLLLTCLLTMSNFSDGGGIALPAQEIAAIDKVRQDFNTAFSAGDIEAMGRLIAEEGVWMPPAEPQIKGKDAVKARYAKAFTEISSKMDLKPGEIQGCTDWAYMHGDFDRTDTLKAGGRTQRVAGHYLLILQKQPDGSWKISRDIWNVHLNP